MTTRLVRSGNGRTVHTATCKRAGRKAVPWNWAEGKTRDQLRSAETLGVRFCKVCDPLSTVSAFIWYDEFGIPCSFERAQELLGELEGRVVAQTTLEFFGHRIIVSTMFVPVDHNKETWGAVTDEPSLWVSEIIGGPDDLNGATECYTSRQEAKTAHRYLVERAVAAGCVVVS